MGEQSNTDTNHPTLFSSGVAGLVAVLVLALAAPAAAGDNRGSAEEAQDMVARTIAYYDEIDMRRRSPPRWGGPLRSVKRD